MPNGFHGSREEWERVTATLERLDPTLEDFGEAHELSLERNTRNIPSRSFRWDSPVERLIQIYPDGDTWASWTLWICAHEDRSGVRYWKHETLLTAASIDELVEALPDLLEQGWQLITCWTTADLEKA